VQAFTREQVFSVHGITGHGLQWARSSLVHGQRFLTQGNQDNQESYPELSQGQGFGAGQSAQVQTGPDILSNE